MINNKRVLIVIPALNESGSIGDVVREVRGELPSVDVLVVDDGSTDQTAKVAAAAGAAVAKLPFNLGVGGAMRLGYRYARDNDYDVAIQVDADGQHDPRYVPKLVDALDEADLVIGARFAGEGDYRVGGPRRWAMIMLSGVLSSIAKTRLTDTTSGFRAANRRVIEMFAAWYPVEYLGDTVETLVHTARRGYKVRQVPVAMRKRMAGTPSQSPLKAMIYLGRAFAVLTLALVRR
ncbi:glycosyltransferase family 2 protein [Micromonospora sonneratiae]|uniref:Glycosyltransferase family 2 protein n=1 Tax=Micromonospora sonneratiae TaxID=1184706 RepID=A0ABW3YES9_9ACTN